MAFTVYDTPDPPPEHFHPVRLKLSDRLKRESSSPSLPKPSNDCLTLCLSNLLPICSLVFLLSTN